MLCRGIFNNQAAWEGHDYWCRGCFSWPAIEGSFRTSFILLFSGAGGGFPIGIPMEGGQISTVSIPLEASKITQACAGLCAFCELCVHSYVPKGF